MKKALKILVIVLLIIAYLGTCYTINTEIIEEKEIALESEPIIISAPQNYPAPKPIIKIIEETPEEKYQKEISQLDEIKEDMMEYILQYKTILDKYPEISSEIATIYDVFTEDEITLVCRCIQSEVENCPFFAKVHVAEVVLNRLYSDAYPNEISKVVVPGQFSLSRDYYSEESLLAFEYAYLFETEEMFDCFNFQSAGESETFCGRTLKYYDGYHWFY